jgi:hypothetical protein
MAFASLPSIVAIDGQTVGPGQRRRIELPALRLATQTPLAMPVEIVCGVRPGPRLWLSAALHGDELNGLEIIRRVLDRLQTRSLSGQVLAVPIVNVFGFLRQERYLPDRRDLNRSFPGSPRGSVAARLAHLLMTRIIGQCSHGIDLHTASLFRTNLPQVRGNLDDEETRRMAMAFGAPIMLHGEAPRGSLRDACAQRGIPVIVYEAGEPQRFNPEAIDAGVKGVLRVLTALGMLRGRRPRRHSGLEARRSIWVRARSSGVLRLGVKIGHRVSSEQVVGVIGDVFGDEQLQLHSPADGVVIGATQNPMVNQGDAVVHIAQDVTAVT